MIQNAHPFSLFHLRAGFLWFPEISAVYLRARFLWFRDMIVVRKNTWRLFRVFFSFFIVFIPGFIGSGGMCHILRKCVLSKLSCFRVPAGALARSFPYSVFQGPGAFGPMSGGLRRRRLFRICFVCSRSLLRCPF